MKKLEVKNKEMKGFLDINVIYLISFAIAMFVISYFAMNILAKGL